MTHKTQEDQHAHVTQPRERHRLPLAWEWSKVDEVGKVQLGRQRAPEHHVGPSMRPYLRVANVFEAKIDTSDVLAMNFDSADYERYRLVAGDILLNEGQSRELVGRPAIYRDEVPGACFQNTLVRFQAENSILPEWALTVFRTYLHDGTFRSIAQWTTNIAHLGAGRFAKLDFPVAPINEQHRIVEVLDSYLTRLDAAAEGLKRVEANLKRYRASVLKAAVEGRLVPTEAELAKKEGRDYEPASALLERILTERRRRWVESGKKGKYEEPAPPHTSNRPDLPEGWCWLTIDAFAFVTKLAGFEYTKFVQYDPRGDLAVIKAENAGKDGFNPTAFSYVRSESVAHLARSRLVAGDVLMVFVGAGTGKVARVPGDQQYFLGPNIAMIRSTTNHVLPAYLELYLRSPLGNQLSLSFAKAVAQPSLSMRTIRMISVALPPPSEQERIVTEVERSLGVAERTLKATQVSLARAVRLRQSILKWAFEGKLVDQDPNDEPASVLLERIRKERAAAPESARSTRGRKKNTT